MDDVFGVGGHTLVFEDPELCFITWGEHVTAEEIRELHDEVKRRAAGRARVFVLSDSTRLKSIESNARRAIADMIDVPNLRGSASYGMAFQTRVTALLLVKLLEIAGKLGSAPVRMFATGREARTFIEDLRRRA